MLAVLSIAVSYGVCSLREAFPNVFPVVERFGMGPNIPWEWHDVVTTLVEAVGGTVEIDG